MVSASPSPEFFFPPVRCVLREARRRSSAVPVPASRAPSLRRALQKKRSGKLQRRDSLQPTRKSTRVCGSSWRPVQSSLHNGKRQLTGKTTTQTVRKLTDFWSAGAMGKRWRRGCGLAEAAASPSCSECRSGPPRLPPWRLRPTLEFERSFFSGPLSFVCANNMVSTIPAPHLMEKKSWKACAFAIL